MSLPETRIQTLARDGSDARPPSARLPAIDWMRGLVVVLMAVDHAGVLFDAGHIATDSIAFAPAGRPLALDHFLTRWITHLCAPSFVFLAGAALALSAAKRRSLGAGESAIDRRIALRGAVLLVLEVLAVSGAWSLLRDRYVVVLQVLYAIGVGLLSMVALRRLPPAVLLALALATLAGGEALALAFWDGTPRGAHPIAALTVAIGASDSRTGGVLAWECLYPALPWLAVMLLGWVFGRHLLALRQAGRSPVAVLLVSGVGLLGAFAFLRALNGYGNMGLLRQDASLVEWLRVSKYPPSASFMALTLGLMALALAACFRVEETMKSPASRWNPLLVFGETPLFFYVLHFPVLIAFASTVGELREARGGLTETFAATFGALAILYPLCRIYRRWKARRSGWLAYF